MKILYSKFNSERNTKFQLQTIIFEENGKKFVKKEALNSKSKAHIKKMVDNYKKLSESIVNPSLKVVPLVKSDESSVTFEFIDGESLEDKFMKAYKQDKTYAIEIINSYIEFLANSFKTTKFDISMVNDDMLNIFGENKYKKLKNLVSFKDISNIDLIFSNIIYKDDEVYIIDYEWTYDISLPLDYIAHRLITMLPYVSLDDFPELKKYDKIFNNMERHFIDKFVMKKSFYFYKFNYLKENFPIAEHIKIKDELLQGKENHINEIAQKLNDYHNEIIILREELIKKDSERDKLYDERMKLYDERMKLHDEINNLHDERNNLNNVVATLHAEQINLHNQLSKVSENLNSVGKELSYARSVVEYRDQQLEAFRIKNRLKKVVNKILPYSVVQLFGDRLKVVTPVEKLKDKIVTEGYNCRNPELTQNVKDMIKNFEKKPLFSIIMPVYNVEPKWLELAIKSIEAQWYVNWELCIADDKSTNKNTRRYLKSIRKHPKIKVKFLKQNLNISGASNEAISLASGDYIVLMDNDDEITPDALYEVAKKINESDADFIYSDEDLIDIEGDCFIPHFKPDFSPDLLLSHNYITHLATIKRTILEKVGKFNSEFDGSQDYDLFLRITESTDKIEHIQKVLYHWRTLETSTNLNVDAKPESIEHSKKLLETTLKRRGVEATVESGNMPHYYRVRYKIKNNPLISIVIPFKDKPELLDICVNSILEKSTYENFEIIGISNNSEEKETFELMKSLEKKDSRIKFYEYNVEFNYAKINNYAVEKYAKGEHILLLNNDIEVITPDWLESMLEHSQREEIGCVGAKLYYPNDIVQHAGVIIGLGGYAGHSHKMHRRDSYGYYNRLHLIQNLSAVTGACLMLKKSIYDEVNGMDELNFKVAFNDVDFCLRVREKGYLNLFTPYAELYHHESISRGLEDTAEKIARFESEKDALYNRHKEIIENGDPYYNPNLTLAREDFGICIKE